MYRFLIILTFFCDNSCNIYNGTFSNYNSKQKEIADSNIVLKENHRIAETKVIEDEQIKLISGNRARGLDSMVGIKKERAMPILSKYNFATFPGKYYPYIKEILRIRNFNKWQHSATLYIYIDSSDRICKMNYFFEGTLANSVSDSFKNNLLESLEDTYEYIPPQTAGKVYEDNPNPRIKHLIILDSVVCINWEDRFSSRRLYHLQGGKILYSVVSLHYMYTKAHDDTEAIRQNIHEPILDTQK